MLLYFSIIIAGSYSSVYFLPKHRSFKRFHLQLTILYHQSAFAIHSLLWVYHNIFPADFPNCISKYNISLKCHITFNSLLDTTECPQSNEKPTHPKLNLPSPPLPSNLLLLSNPDPSKHPIHPAILARNLVHSRPFILFSCSISNQLLRLVF